MEKKIDSSFPSIEVHTLMFILKNACKSLYIIMAYKIISPWYKINVRLLPQLSK